MSNEPNPSPRSDSAPRFHWNLWGILGGTVGPTLFLLFGVFELWQHPGFAFVLLILFLLPLLVARLLWQRRDSLPAYTGVQILLPVVIFSVFAGALIFYRFGITVPLLVDRPVALPELIGIPVSYIVIAFFLWLYQRHQPPIA